MAELSYTNVSFLTGVPFDNSYAHTRWFQTKSQQYSYFKRFEKFVRTFNNFQKINGRYFIDLKANVEDTMDLNYLMFKNAQYSNKWFYCFITNVQSLNKSVTRIYFEVDVIQTWRFDISFKKSFIAREHENQSNNWNVLPEGIGVGNEYEIISEYNVKPLPFYYIVICVKEMFDTVSKNYKTSGSFIGTPNTINYYFIPIPNQVEGIGPQPNYLFDATNPIPDAAHGYKTSGVKTFQSIIKNFKDNADAPKNIVSNFVTDYLPIEVNDDGNFKYTFPNCIQTNFGNEGSDTPTTVYVIKETNDFNHIISKKIGNVFSDVNEPTSKLRYYPYTLIEFSDGRGNVVNYKPEGLRYVNGDINVNFLGAIYYYNWVTYAMGGYNKKTELSRSDLISNALINSDPQDIAVLDDRTTAYLQGAKNSLEAQKNTWGTDLKYQKISNTIRGATSAANIGANAVMKNPNPNAYIDDVGNTAQAFTNYMKAGEDYQNKVAEQNAMLEDINNQPPSMIKQGSNISGGLGNNQSGIRVTIKRVREDYLQKARWYFHVFGYKSNDFKVPNLYTRQYFNYIQTTMCNVQCNFYNEDILRIKSIFDSGITLWHTDDLYNYDVVNGVI